MGADPVGVDPVDWEDEASIGCCITRYSVDGNVSAGLKQNI